MFSIFKKRRPKPEFSAGQLVLIVPPRGAHYMRAHYLHIHRLHWSKKSQEWLYDGQVLYVPGLVLVHKRYIHDVAEHRLDPMRGDTWK